MLSTVRKDAIYVLGIVLALALTIAHSTANTLPGNDISIANGVVSVVTVLLAWLSGKTTTS